MNAASHQQIWNHLDDTGKSMICAIYESTDGMARAPTGNSRLTLLELLDQRLVEVRKDFRMIATPLGKDVAEYGLDAAFEVWRELPAELKDGLARLANQQRVLPDCLHTLVFEELCRRKLVRPGPAGGVLDGYQILPWGMRLYLVGKMTVLS